MNDDEITATASPCQTLWYTAPARDWLEGLPIGTGRLAAMVMGTHKRDRLALNHEWLWKGTHRFRDTEKRSHLLGGVRELLLAGNYEEGTDAGNEAFGGPKYGTHHVDPYQPAGDLYVEFNHGVTHDYRRELDLKRACAAVSYQTKRETYSRQYIAHLKEDLILIRLEAGGKPFTCTVWLDRNYDPDCELTFSSSETIVAMDASIRDGIDFRVEARLWHKGGRAHVVQGAKITVDDAEEIIISINVGTSAGGGSPAAECAAGRLSEPPIWDELFRSHVDAYSRHYDVLELDMPLDAPDIPTDARIRSLREGERDPALGLLYFNYGRYLLCASTAAASARGTGPPTTIEKLSLLAFSGNSIPKDCRILFKSTSESSNQRFTNPEAFPRLNTTVRFARRICRPFTHKLRRSLTTCRCVPLGTCPANRSSAAVCVRGCTFVLAQLRRPPWGESVSLGSAATEAYVMAANPKNQNARIVSLAVIAPHLLIGNLIPRRRLQMALGVRG